MFQRFRNQVDVVEAARRQEGGAVILDVRTPGEVSEAKVPGSVHVSMASLPQQLPRLQRKHADDEILVICRSGNRSAQATAFLRQAGLDAMNIKGGILAWRRAGLPLQSRKRARR